ncbi:hypothetical protein AVEN_84053-1 [Araneus ventricosus]|uniref:Histone-lysine N-methyltransferase SETMAR n=1 Tax=Araneus ventricosus TaxID=182803 RepID=A0A4Y2NLG9_ARAVE|nr:hypothetical protein AVEN_84053-1 [Araneus ventricosus]
MMDSSRSAQRAVIKFLRAEGEHGSQIYGCVRRTVSRTVHHIPVLSALRGGTRKHPGLPRTEQEHIVTNNATISVVDELIRQNRRITTREITVELSISKGSMHHMVMNSGCPNRSKPSYGIVLLQDNARPHVAKKTLQLLEKFRWEVLQHPPYNTDIPPCDSHILGPLKKGQRFTCDKDV